MDLEILSDESIQQMLTDQKDYCGSIEIIRALEKELHKRKAEKI